MDKDLNIFQQQDYRQAVKMFLRGKEDKPPRGSVKRLAESMKCHSTFVAHVLNGKADLSTEQALRFCRHFHLDEDATAFFLDLVAQGKAGDTQTKAYFTSRLKQRKADRLNLKKRLKVQEVLTSDQEAVYYQNWLLQTVHIYTQLPGKHSIDSICHALGIDPQSAQSIIDNLVDLGFLAMDKGNYHSVRDSVHLGAESPAIAKNHYNWRLKTIQELMTHRKLPGMHYSSVMSMSHNTARELQEVLLKHIEEIREQVIPSDPEQLYVYCLDFYGLTRQLKS